MYPNLNKVVVVLVSFFTGKLGDSASDHSSDIYEIKTKDDLINYVRVNFSTEAIEGKHFYSLLGLEQGELSFHDYTQEFNISYV